jgi:hypothetical protein
MRVIPSQLVSAAPVPLPITSFEKCVARWSFDRVVSAMRGRKTNATFECGARYEQHFFRAMSFARSRGIFFREMERVLSS